MSWRTVIILGLFAFSGLPQVSAYKYVTAYEADHKSSHHKAHHKAHHQVHQQASHGDYEESNSNHYPLTGLKHQSLPPDNEEENTLTYEYKEFEYPHHEEPQKQLVPVEAVESQSKFGWLFKLGLILLGKFILKVILIKKIIKFFTIMFFLFFVPAFFATIAKHLTIGRGFGRKFNDEKLKTEEMENLATFVYTAIEGFQKAKKCQSNTEEWSCRLNAMFSKVDTKYPLKGIKKYFMKNFAQDLRKFDPSFTPTKVESS